MVLLTVDDLVAQLTLQRLRALADDDQDTEPDATVLDKAEQRALTKVAMWVGVVYDSDALTAEQNETYKRIVLDVTIERLYLRKKEFANAQGASPWALQYKEAVEDAKALRENVARIPNQTPANSGGGIRPKRTRVFDDMGGYLVVTAREGRIGV